MSGTMQFEGTQEEWDAFVKRNKQTRMNNEFISYEQAFELKELGFNEHCFAFYNNYPPTPIKLEMYCHCDKCDNSGCPAPLYQQAFRWFRDKHKIHAVVEITIESQWYFSIYNLAAKRNAEIEDTIDYKEGFITYEESELACLKKLIEIVKNK